jgi:dynein heavy chain
MSYQSMAQIFMDLSQSGAWGCFDEFKRISIEALSVVSTQVMTILDALKRRDLMFDFMKEKITLVDSVCLFITMNPGYAGRTELPENLKALFRSCAMVVSDIALICENMLMSEGFQTAEILAKKFVTFYDLSKALLSKQRHYDWGLCTVESVLRQTSKLRRADTDVEKDRLLKRALRDFNLPKIVTHDREISKNLIDDLFSGVKVRDKFDAELKKLVILAAKELGYNTSENGFALK